MEILLRNGCLAATARDLACDLLAEHGGLLGLGSLEPSYLERRGVGEARTSTLVATFEIARRVAKAKMPERRLLDRPDQVASYLMLRYAADQETMGALFLDVRNRLIGESEVYRGTLRRAAVEPRAIFREALLRRAAGLLLFHTHPSGDPSPSIEDLAFHRRMLEAGEVLGVKLLDQIILGGAGRWVALGNWARTQAHLPS